MAEVMENTTVVANNRGNAILSVCIACGVIQTFAVALRFLARRRIKTRLQIDDWFIFGSLWPNYAMIVIGGFREYTSIDIQCHGYGLTPYSVVGEGKAGLPIAYLTRQQKVVFLQVRIVNQMTPSSAR